MSYVGGVLGLIGGDFEHFGAILRHPEASCQLLNDFAGVLTSLGGILVSSWPNLGSSWLNLGSSWAHLGPIWLQVEFMLGHFEAYVEVCWGMLGSRWQQVDEVTLKMPQDG